MSEINAAKRWIHATLKASTALCALIGGSTAPRIYDSEIPQAESGQLPCVVYQLQAPGADLMEVGTTRIWGNGVYLVRGVAEFPYANLDAIADAIDAAIHGKGGSTVAGVVHYCVREQPFELDETPITGDRVRHAGGLYRIRST